jgi:hypothetical protein
MSTLEEIIRTGIAESAQAYAANLMKVLLSANDPESYARFKLGLNKLEATYTLAGELVASKFNGD